MARVLRPRRGLKQYATSQNIVLAKGEVFFAYGNNDYATTNSVNEIYLGDGSTSFSNLKPFITNNNSSSVDYATNSGTAANLYNNYTTNLTTSEIQSKNYVGDTGNEYLLTISKVQKPTSSSIAVGYQSTYSSTGINIIYTDSDDPGGTAELKNNNLRFRQSQIAFSGSNPVANYGISGSEISLKYPFIGSLKSNYINKNNPYGATYASTYTADSSTYLQSMDMTYNDITRTFTNLTNNTTTGWNGSTINSLDSYLNYLKTYTDEQIGDALAASY